MVHLWISFVIFQLMSGCFGNHDAKRLYDDLLEKKGYNRLVRPVSNHTKAVKVKFGLRFAQLNDVDEKNEIMTTNMWLMQEWDDVNLVWEKEEYGGVDRIYVPSESIWLPDVVLYNNADGDYAVTIMTKATLFFSGKVQWNPPAIFKSQCDINVEYFPFDIQMCKMIFLPWSHDGFKIDMQHQKRTLYLHNPEDPTENPVIEKAIDMSTYVQSQEWDVLAMPAIKNIAYYPCCPEPFPDLTFNITLRRKTLFYTINIITPIICINLLTLTGFYVPCECNEKISICITILLSLSMFQLLLFDLVPGTSVSIPLLGKFILFTLFVTSGSIVCSVIVLNVNHRATHVGEMPQFLKWLFLDALARLLCMPKPTAEEQDQEIEDQIDWSLAQSDLSNYVNPYKKRFRQRKSIIQETIRRIGDEDNVQSSLPGFSLSPTFVGFDSLNMDGFCEACAARRQRKYPPNYTKAIEGVTYIAKHAKKKDEDIRVKYDWIYFAMVVDRFLLWIYITLSFLCTMALLLNAPALFDKRPGLSSKDT